MEELKRELDAVKAENEKYKALLSKLSFSFIHKEIPDEEAGGETRTNGAFQEEEFTIFPEFEPFEQFFSEIADCIPHHITVIDPKGVVRVCNKQTAKDFQMEQDEIIGRPIQELLNLPEEEILVLQTLKTKKEYQNYEVWDSNYGIINTKIIYNLDGSISRVIGIFDFLNRSRDAEKFALSSRIAAGMAHEVRNPLTTVRGYLQFFEDSVDPHISDLFHSLLIPEIDRASKVINDFLTISKPNVQKTECFQVGEFFRNYLGNFLAGEMLLSKAEMNYEISNEAAGCWIEGDREALLQVFMNLYRNALEANQSCALKIKIQIDISDVKLKIQFCDNGGGIEAKNMDGIFDPYFTTKEEGTGLGLSVSRKIIEYHKGTIEVCNGRKGAVFTILLPFQKGTIR
ncbi:ATP-binding protein [Bacillus massiliglaciei]|uniref:ATP-binding protein n=1 Tax=Bacillus massiliglaciei TaxID=1816693 RepID=UPI000DA61ECA|nr:ATP-binding protein [Bacillus massiliglaciei]